MNLSNSWLDRKDVRDYVLGLHEAGESNRRIAKAVTEAWDIPTSDRSISRAVERWAKQETEVKTIDVSGDEATVTTEPRANAKPEIGDPEQFMREHNIDPAEWDVTGQKLNWWDSPTGDTLYQQTVHLKRKVSKDVIHPARADGWQAPKQFKTPAKGDPQLVVFAGDQQAPFHDEGLHHDFCMWLKDHQPHKGILIGDTVDFPDVSRHRHNPERNATVNECVQSGYNLLRDYVDSSPSTRWQKLSGNHDERIRNAVLDQLRELYGVRRAVTPEDDNESAVLGIEHLLRLDELGIDYVDPQGEYAQGQIKVTENLAARHGWLAKKGAGSSALATLEHLGFSVLIGHTHRQSLVHKTTHDIDGKPETVAAAEIGCMAQIEGGLGYAVSPDWQNGFATATIWPDGFFKIDLATFVNGTLLWRDERY